MKYKIVLPQIFVIVALISCNKEKQERNVTCSQIGYYTYLDKYPAGPLCTTDICNHYQTIWKELFLEKNGLTEAYFNEHIVLCQSDTSSCDEGFLYRISYRVKIDWAISWNSDQFIIKIKKDNNLYPSINLPRNEYLSKENIRTALDNKAFSSNMTTLSNDEILKFNSNETALDKLIKNANVNTLCTNWFYINELGHIALEAHAEYDNEINTCITGSVDLINGSTLFYDAPCKTY